MYDWKSGSGKILAGFYFNFLMIKMQKLSFSGFWKPVYAKLQINFTSELFLKSIKNILLCKLSCWTSRWLII